MGAGASISTLTTVKKELEKLPDIFDATTAREILALDFDPVVFDELKADASILQKSIVLKYYDNLCDSAASITATEAPSVRQHVSHDSPPDESKHAPNLSKTDFKVMHSLLRWNKPTKRENLENILKRDPYSVHARNSCNGNYPLHIAAQNKYADLCQLLLTAKHDPNKKNFFGQTALHVAIGCGYNDVANVLLCNGADPAIQNNQGIPAALGYEGLAPIKAAETAKDMNFALDVIQKYCKTVDKYRYIDSVLDKKKTLMKSANNWWSDEIESKVRKFIWLIGGDECLGTYERCKECVDIYERLFPRDSV